MTDDTRPFDTTARGGNAPGTQDPADAPADIGAERTTRTGQHSDTSAGRGRGSGVLADPEVIDPDTEPNIANGNRTSLTDAAETGPRSGMGS